MIRFGMWDAKLAEPTPDPKLRGLTGGYTYAKTVALAAKGRTDEAKARLVDLERIATLPASTIPPGSTRPKATLRADYEKVWIGADVELTASAS